MLPDLTGGTQGQCNFQASRMVAAANRMLRAERSVRRSAHGQTTAAAVISKHPEWAGRARP